MARPLRIEYKGAVYHVTARGSEREKIFFSKRDYEKFKEYLAEAKEKHGFILHSYVLIAKMGTDLFLKAGGKGNYPTKPGRKRGQVSTKYDYYPKCTVLRLDPYMTYRTFQGHSAPSTTKSPASRIKRRDSFLRLHQI